MLTITLDEWSRYRDILSKISTQAAEEFRNAVWSASGYFKGVGLGNIPRQELIDYAYALVTKYGEGAAAVACEAYDEIAALSGVVVPPAVPAETASYGDVARNLNGVLKFSENEELIIGVVGRLVKQAGADTTLQNAGRDKAQYAWIPHGLTCPYCIAIASLGWRDATDPKANAPHIHANCDCEFSVRFHEDTKVEGYNPDKYKRMYMKADPKGSSKDKLNAMRRKAYEHHGTTEVYV